MEIKKYITENEPKMLEDLFSLIRIPSISAKHEHHDDMLDCPEPWEQFLPDKTIAKTKKLDRVKRVVKTDFCYFVVFNDIGNAVICERCLLKKGTFAAFEALFPGKMREREM